ncbi:MAG: hypothetical protein ACK5MQ_14570 [Pikeienuella sp.]
MQLTRRQFAAAAGVAVLPFAARAAGDRIASARGEWVITPISHASFVMETPAGVIYADPVGGAPLYDAAPPPDLVLITHKMPLAA